MPAQPSRQGAPHQNEFDKSVELRNRIAKMKAKLITVICILVICLTGATPCSAADDVEMAADAIVVRPACFLATIVGSAVFVISLPVALTSGSVHRSAHVFVVRPARATFTRKLGDIEAMKE